MKLALTAAAEEVVVTVAAQKSFMKVDLDAEDSTIEQMIAAATKKVEVQKEKEKVVPKEEVITK